MKLFKKGILKLGICRYLNLRQRIKLERKKALIELREEQLKLKLELVDDRDRFLKEKLNVVRNLIDYQLELNTVSETQIKIIREFLGEPVMEKIRGLNINIAHSDIEKVTLKQTSNDREKESLGEQKSDP
ncbi:hypothetical protein KDU71_07745 [Carboxylicivirga sediminis]|uniref:Uncharacterized protein n=1 Tax=Carboxylicivirga sediminis TaxID=2006564 RepID=A0A941F3U1_9BACT|nr:hypothetical protein [Carboxylicivirga sediminis]MBR8535448.1 hypothetical protein [Carboxylicivirga sediminis]